MLDDLRNSANSSLFGDEEEEVVEVQPRIKVSLRRKPAASSTARPARRSHFLGMTAPQRFLLALMLFMMTTVFGALVLVVTESISLPF